MFQKFTNWLRSRRQGDRSQNETKYIEPEPEQRSKELFEYHSQNETKSIKPEPEQSTKELLEYLPQNETKIIKPEPEQRTKSMFLYYPTGASLDAIDDYCLAQICQHLNLFELANLISSCNRVQQFASIVPFTERFRHLEITCICPRWKCMYGSAYLVTTTDELRTLLEHIGAFVEHLTFKRMDCNRKQIIFDGIEFIIELFPNLQTLSIVSFAFAEKMLMNVTPHLKALHLIKCVGITNEWSNSLKRLTELTELTVTGRRNQFNAALFQHCTKLTALTTEGISIFDIHPIFGANCDSLRAVKFVGFRERRSSRIIYYGSSFFNTLNRYSLPKLEKLAIDCIIDAIPGPHSFDYYHLKVLELRCETSFAVDTLMRELSRYGIIEELTIMNAELNLVADVPLRFRNLKSLQFHFCHSYLNIMKMATRAWMPVLKQFIYNEISENLCCEFVRLHESPIMEWNEFRTINNLVVSKKGLKLLCLALRRHHVDVMLMHLAKLTCYGTEKDQVLVTLRNNADMVEMEKILVALSIYPFSNDSYSQPINLERTGIELNHIYLNSDNLQKDII